MDFKKQLEVYRQQIEEGINHWLPPADTRPAILHQAMRYSAGTGGKRLRPVLLLAVYDLFASSNNPLGAAVALECIHTYSLIHDDLPCMDDSPLRRGRPTCHIQFDEPTAVLAGDALLTYAFEVLGKAYEAQPSLGLTLTLKLAEAAGSQKLIGGQMEDIIYVDGGATAEHLDWIHGAKTAALFSAACTMGACIAQADKAAVHTLVRIGEDIGLAFQIVDDILDTPAEDSEQELTYPRFHGLEASRQKVSELSQRAIERCRQLEADTAFLVALIEDLQHRVC